MDLLTHAVAGAATGLIFGQPLLGAAAAVAPDLVLGFKRKARPSQAYNATHSLAAAVLMGATMGFLYPGAGWTVLLAMLSHLVLDRATHGPEWGPTLLYPWSEKRFYGELGEWEFFNQSWWHGLWLTAIWCLVCLMF